MEGAPAIVVERGEEAAALGGGVFAACAGAFLAGRIAIVFVCVRALGMEPSGGSVVGVGLGFLLLAGACFHSLDSGRSIVTTTAIPRWASAYLALALLSLTWSATVAPLTSFVYWLGMAADVATIAILLRAQPAERLAGSLARGFVYAAAVVAVMAWLLPVNADLRLGDEEFLNTNQIGNLCATAVFFTQYLSGRGSSRGLGRRWLLTVLLFVTTLRSLSKTTLVAFLITQAWFTLRDKELSRAAKRRIFAVGTVALLLFAGLFMRYFEVYTDSGKAATTLTGRTGIWLYVLDEIPERPWFGHGFDSMWKVIPPFGPDRFEARHAEDEWLQQMYAYGVVGLALTLCVYVSLFRRMRRAPHGPARQLVAALLLYTMIRSLAEAEAFDLLLPLWSIVLFSHLLVRRDSKAEVDSGPVEVAGVALAADHV